MTLDFTGWISLFFGVTLLLAALSLLMRRGLRPGLDTYSTPAKFFLVALRLAIGWHFFFEGLEKLNSPTWSSEAYLREAIGPLAEPFHELAGDRLLDKLTVAADSKELPPALSDEWQAYHDAFLAYYSPDVTQTYQIDGRKVTIAGLTEAQQTKINAAYEKSRADLFKWLTAGKDEVKTVAAYPPDLFLSKTMALRIEEYHRLEARVAEAGTHLPSTDTDVQKRYKDAKADLAKWRADMKKSLDTQTAAMKKAHTDVLTKEQADDRVPLERHLAEPSWRDRFATLSTASKWGLLDWADVFVKYSLLALGGLLMVGLFSRLASFAGALLVLSFYLALPALPGWPEGPRLEGHYVLINKTLIEVIALLALTCIPTGRWAGIDGVLQLFSRRAPAGPVG